MKSDCKTVCILMDENDLEDFENSYGYAISKEYFCVPFDYISMMQVIFHEFDGAYYIPKIDESEFSVAKRIYAESQKFLKQLLLTNKIVDKTEDSFPLEYFWFRLWSCVHRTISFCDDFLAQHSVEEVVLIKRNKFVNTGGLLINTTSFTDLVEAFFKSKNVKVKILKHQECYIKPKTIFYTQTHNLKSLLKLSINFVYWKTMSFNKKNYDYILINPAYDNVINYCKPFKCSAKMSPQVFHGGQIPFLHSWRKLLKFLIASVFFKYRYSDNNRYIVKPYKSDLHEFEFNFADFFQDTIVQYLSDVRWMKNYINMFWDNCLGKGKRYLTIFSLPPVHLHSYFLIKKTKENGGKVAVWQHGGFYGYTDKFQHYITDYKNTDYFLSFGKSNLKEITKGMSGTPPTCVEVGSNVMYGKSNLRLLQNEWVRRG